MGRTMGKMLKELADSVAEIYDSDFTPQIGTVFFKTPIYSPGYNTKLLTQPLALGFELGMGRSQGTRMAAGTREFNLK